MFFECSFSLQLQCLKDKLHYCPLSKRNNSLQSEPSKYSKVNNTDNLIIFTFTLGQSLAESVDDRESQSTVVATAVDTAAATVATATVDVQSVVAHSPLHSSLPLLLLPLLPLLLLLLLQKSVLELHNPLLHHSHLHYQEILLRVRMRNQLNQNTLFTHMG